MLHHFSSVYDNRVSDGKAIGCAVLLSSCRRHNQVDVPEVARSIWYVVTGFLSNGFTCWTTICHVLCVYEQYADWRWQRSRYRPSRVVSIKCLKVFFRCFSDWSTPLCNLLSRKKDLPGSGTQPLLGAMWLELLHGSCLRRAARENGFNWKHRRRESKIIPCDLILQGAKGSSLKSHKASFPAHGSPGPEGTSRSCRVCCSPCHVQVRRFAAWSCLYRLHFRQELARTMGCAGQVGTVQSSGLLRVLSLSPCSRFPVPRCGSVLCSQPWQWQGGLLRACCCSVRAL